MSMNALLIDAGNTRIKWALARNGALASHGHSAHRGRAPEEALRPIAELDARPSRVVASNVGGEALAEVLREVVEQRFGVALELAIVRREAFGLRIAYEHPSHLGSDRWLAMIGARESFGGPLLVVCAGTALTLDAADATGAHYGGLIVPGIATMKGSLLSGTAGIRDAGDAAASAGGAPDIFATDTGPAVSGGAAHALAALVERAAGELARRSGATPALVITGGDAGRIAPLIAHSVNVEPDLVLRGLVVYARDR
jgi:type III pantothenate kinase